MSYGFPNDMIDRSAWAKRCAARLVAAGGFDPHLAHLHAQALAANQAELHGESGVAWGNPEDAADQDIADELDDEA